MKTFFALACAVALAAATPYSRANDYQHGPAPRVHVCPKCSHKVCVPERTTDKVKKSCFNVEQKEVCIPKFRWPWECCDTLPGCGRVRVVNQLVVHEYECDKCAYKWKLKEVCSCQCGAPSAAAAAPERTAAPWLDFLWKR